MRTRERHGIELRADATSARSLRVGPGPDPAAGPTRRLWLLAGGLSTTLVLATVTTVALSRTAGRDEVVVNGEASAADQPAGLQQLGFTVDVPASVVAGERARFTVRWTDGAGSFSGSSEDWGDGVATSSRKQGRCEPGAVAAPAAGTYSLRHTWTGPGTYPVVIAVATYTCEGGSAVEEEAAKTVTVEVAPAG